MTQKKAFKNVRVFVEKISELLDAIPLSGRQPVDWCELSRRKKIAENCLNHLYDMFEETQVTLGCRGDKPDLKIEKEIVFGCISDKPDVVIGSDNPNEVNSGGDYGDSTEEPDTFGCNGPKPDIKFSVSYETGCSGSKPTIIIRNTIGPDSNAKTCSGPKPELEARELSVTEKICTGPKPDIEPVP